MGPGPANPRKVPYYVLIVGPPSSISFRFQYELDAQYAVGRVCFDTAEEYRTYAESVVRAEDAEAGAVRTADLFAPTHEDDRATELSRTQLVEPLAEELAAEVSDWTINPIVGTNATKQELANLLWGDTPAGVLVTAGHGLGFPPRDPDRDDAQGALLCADWRRRPKVAERVDAAAYMSAKDVPERGPVRARVIFAFACYGAGTPDEDDFVHRGGAVSPVVVKGEPFVSRLPQALLAHPAGGALAFIGHVDRAWSWSISWPGAGSQIEAFVSTLVDIAGGKRIGHAMEYFAVRAMEISGDLTSLLYSRDQHGKLVDPREVSRLWTANNDARSYVTIGDPAVRATGG
jgi:hypothetical protein